MMNTEDAITLGETEITLPASLPSACNTHMTHLYEITGPDPNPPYTEVYSSASVYDEVEWMTNPSRTNLNKLPVIDFVGTAPNLVVLPDSKVKSDFEGRYTG